MFESFRLQIFCCCCNLRTGSLVIGTLGWLMTLIQLFYLTSPLKEESNRYKVTEDDIAAEIAYSIVTLIVCLAMIYGVYKNNRRFILPYLVLKCIECIAWAIIILIVFVLFFYTQAKLFIMFMFFVIVIATTIDFYFWLCVWSLYMDVHEDINATGIEMTKNENVETNKGQCPEMV